MQANVTTQYLHSIIDQNQQLRLRVSKLEEIQKYMEALLKRCEELQQEKAHNDSETREFIEQNSILQRELAKIKQSHKEQIKMVLLEHDSIMRQMQEELKIIRSQYQRESIISDELRQGNHLKQNELKLLQDQFRAFTKQADQEISHLRESLIINEKQYQLLAEEHKLQKSQFLNEKEEMMKELYHLKAVVGRQMKRHIEQIESQNSSLLKEAEGLRKYNEQIARNATLRQNQLCEENKTQRLDFQAKQNLLKLELDQVNKTLDQKTQQCSKRLGQSNYLIDQNIRLKRELEISLSNQNKFCFILQESQKQNDNLRQKLIQIDVYIRDQTQKYKQEFYDQRNHNHQLRKILSDKQILINEKLRQIKDLLNIVDQIQSALKLKDKEIQLLKNQTENLETQIKSHLKNLQQKNFQSRTLEEKNRSLKVSVEELQILNGSLKKQILELQTTNHSLKRELLNPRNSNRESEEKIQHLLQSFRKEKQIMYEEHQIEKNKIKQTHEVELRQKEFQFLRKVEYFQEELKRLK